MAPILAGPVTGFSPTERRLVEIDGTEVVVFQHGERFYALDNTCLHMGGPVGKGIIIGKVEADLDQTGRLLQERFSTEEIHIVCPWHGWEYDIETGQAAGARELCLRRYETEVRDGNVYVLA